MFRIASTEVGEVLLSEYHSDETGKSAYVYKTHEDYRVSFVDTDGVEYEDWRDSLVEAEEAGEDWVLNT